MAERPVCPEELLEYVHAEVNEGRDLSLTNAEARALLVQLGIPIPSDNCEHGIPRRFCTALHSIDFRHKPGCAATRTIPNHCDCGAETVGAKHG